MTYIFIRQVAQSSVLIVNEQQCYPHSSSSPSFKIVFVAIKGLSQTQVRIPETIRLCTAVITLRLLHVCDDTIRSRAPWHRMQAIYARGRHTASPCTSFQQGIATNDSDARTPTHQSMLRPGAHHFRGS